MARTGVNSEFPVSPQILPDFFLVGAERSGTTWIHQRLVEHREVFVPPHRSEIHYFDRNYNQGLAFYERLYREPPGEQIVGDLTPSYMNDPKIAERIAADFPHAKILFSLRHPVDRAYSAYLHQVRNRHLDLSFEACFRQGHDIFEHSRYFQKVKAYYDRFPVERIQVLLYDDLVSAPEMFLTRLLSFLGVNQDMAREFPLENRLANPTVEPRNLFLYRMVTGTVRALRRRHNSWFDRIIEAAKRTGIKRLLARPSIAGEGISHDLRSKLFEYYREDIANLEKLNGLDLSAWRGQRSL